MEKPLVSILMPAYNHAKYIRYAIDSAVNQTYENIEIIVSDNGSNDGTAEIIKSYSDSRIRKHFFLTNTGPANNGNYCYNMAKGKYLAYLFTDDFWDLTKIEKQVAVLENNKDLGACFTHASLINSEGGTSGLDNHPLKRIFFKRNRTQAQWLRYFFFHSNCICCPSAMVHNDNKSKENIGNTGNGVSPALRQLGDFSTWIQLVKLKPIFIIPEKLTYHRARDEGGNESTPTRENLIRHANENKMILQEFFDDMPDELFMEAFCDDLLKKGELSTEERLCEQIFLYLKLGSYLNCGNIIACEKLYDMFKSPVFTDILSSVYGFTINHFYKLSASYYSFNVAAHVTGELRE